MSIFRDHTIQKYVKALIAIVVIFLIVAILFLVFFTGKENVVLKKDWVEFGDDVEITDLVESIGDYRISKSDVKGKVIHLPNYDVHFNNLKADKLGDEQLKLTFTDPNIKDQIFDIKVKDTTSPTITIEENPITMNLEDIKAKKFSDLYEVEDSCTKSEDLLVKEELDGDVDFGKDVTLIISCEDESQNSTEEEIKIHIKEKEPVPEESDKKEESKEIDAGSSLPNTNSEVVQPTPSYIPNNPPVPSQPIPQPQIPRAPKPSNRNFLFSDGYNMGNVSSACEAALVSSGYDGSCIPLQYPDGTYYGMALIFD